MAESTQPEHPAECRNVWQKWAGFLDKELTPEESARVQKHLDDCGNCRDFVETQSSFNRLVRKSLIEDAQKLDETLRVKVLSLLERKSYGALSEEEERANRASSRQAPVPHTHDHGHSHDHGEPGHDHDHAHGHDHSHGMSPATRAAMAVGIVMLLIAVFLVVSLRNKNDALHDRIAVLEVDLKVQEQGAEALADEIKRERQQRILDIQTLKDEAARLAIDNSELQKKYDESVKTSEKLQRALNSLVAAGSAVMKKEEPGKPVSELEKKWKDMFPKIGDMPHKSGDMDPRIWDVTPIEGEDVLWVVFTKKGDPKTQFTLMTFTEKYMKQHYGELKSMAETVKDGMTVLAWPNAKDQKVYHALISTADLVTTRAQLEALK